MDRLPEAQPQGQASHPSWPDHPLDGQQLVSKALAGSVDKGLAILADQTPREYRLAVSDLRDKLATCQHLLANNRRKADELVAEAEQLEDACRPLEEHIDSLQAALRALGGAA